MPQPEASALAGSTCLTLVGGASILRDKLDTDGLPSVGEGRSALTSWASARLTRGSQWAGHALRSCVESLFRR